VLFKKEKFLFYFQRYIIRIHVKLWYGMLDFVGGKAGRYSLSNLQKIELMNCCFYCICGKANAFLIWCFDF